MTPAPAPDDSILSTRSKNEVDLIASNAFVPDGKAGLANGLEAGGFFANGFFAGSAGQPCPHTE